MQAVAQNQYRSSRYRPPVNVSSIRLQDLLAKTKRDALEERQFDLLGSEGSSVRVYYAGEVALLERPCVSVVGTREVSHDGATRARRLARELVAAGIVVVSGLARGVDTEALTSAIELGGSTVAVIGTPIDRAYPAENARLQENIYQHHLLMTPFRIGKGPSKQTSLSETASWQQFPMLLSLSRPLILPVHCIRQPSAAGSAAGCS